MLGNAMTSTPGKSTLVIGIDFGTTYTGVSWLFCKKNMPVREPEVVTHWLSALSKNNDRNKVPSKIHFDKETGEVKWGYNIPTDIEPIQWFKLLLLNERDLPTNLQHSSHIQAARDMVANLGKTAVELVGDYLKVLWQHVITEIKDEKGASLVDGTKFHVVLSVPAIWKDYARDRMHQAAEYAGILEDRLPGRTSIGFISEPEAAALATLPDLENRDDLVVGDNFVVLDAGGGTVDIISYKVQKLEPLTVSECVEGDGALCGATFVDQAFEDLMEQRVGRKSWKLMNSSTVRKMMNNEWEHGIKKDFDGSQEKYCVDLPKRNKRGQLNITADEVRHVFEPVISKIYDLLQKQLDDIESRSQAGAKFVILVGGFGRCPFLFKSLKQRFRDKTDILQARGEKPWTSICRGAALSGAMGRGLIERTVKVHSRIARLSYGWIYTSYFCPGVHDERDRIWDDVEGVWNAGNQLEWGIKRGQDIMALRPKTYKYCSVYKQSRTGRGGQSLKVFTSTEKYPSSRVDDTTSFHSTATYESPLPIQQMAVEKRNQRSMFVWPHEYHMQISGAALSLKIISKGKEVSSKSITMETD